MTFKKRTVVILIFFSAVAGLALETAAEDIGQDERIKLDPKYRSFLAETRSIMPLEEKEIFLGLKTDQERDVFIEAFWQQRGRRQRGVRANINLLMIMRMVQTLDLTEDQISKILPAMNQNAKEKQKLQSEIMKELRALRFILRNETADEQILTEKTGTIRVLEKALREKEAELNAFIEEHLSAVQQAKYILFIQDFYREMREKLNGARQVQRGYRK